VYSDIELFQDLEERDSEQTFSAVSIEEALI